MPCCAHLDADGQHPPAEVARLLEAVCAGRADLVIGSRSASHRHGCGAEGDDYQPTFSRRVGISVFRFFLSLATRQRFTDTTSGMRAANRRVIALFASTTARLRRDRVAAARGPPGPAVKEVPVRMLERAGGTSFLTRCARPSSSSRG